MSEENENEQQENNQRLGTFASKALRGQQGAWERNQAQLIIEGNLSADPAKKISKICDAAIGFEGIKQIKGLDIPFLKRISQVNRDLSNPSRSRFRIDNYNFDVAVSVDWSFKSTEQNFTDFIEPWYVSIDYWPHRIVHHKAKAIILKHDDGYCNGKLGIYFPEELAEAKKKWLGKACPKCGFQILPSRLFDRTFETEKTELVTPSPQWSFFFEASRNLREGGYNLLCNSFHAFAIPVVIKASSLMLKTISPSTYEDALKFLSGKKTEEASYNEDSLDKA